MGTSVPERKVYIKAEGPPIEFIVRIGDGLQADWTAHLRSEDKLVATWKGSTGAAAGEQGFTVPAADLRGKDPAIRLLIVLFGPAEDVPFHVFIEAHQGGENAFEPPFRLSGRAAARQVTTQEVKISFRRRSDRGGAGDPSGDPSGEHETEEHTR